MIYNELTLLAFLGLIVSAYALYVEKKDEKTVNYKPLCNINKKISCTKIFSSSYAKLLGISNSIIGIVFYIGILLILIKNNIELIFYISILSTIATIYLAYLSYYKLRTFCVICTIIYLVNLSIIIISFKLL